MFQPRLQLHKRIHVCTYFFRLQSNLYVTQLKYKVTTVGSIEPQFQAQIKDFAKWGGGSLKNLYFALFTLNKLFTEGKMYEVKFSYVMPSETMFRVNAKSSV